MSARRGAGWLEQWKAEEPLRLYLWTIAGAVLVGGVSTGLLSETWALAIGGVAAAVLMVGGTALARQQAWAPANVTRELDSQHAISYRAGYVSALRTVDEAGPDHAETQQLEKTLGPSTQPRLAADRRCRYVESGRRCTMGPHPDTFRHQLEQRRPVE
jgi:hypothetical protein